MTKALKVRLQKLIDVIEHENIFEFWKEIFDRMQTKERALTKQFKIGDEIKWSDKTGVVLQVNRLTCRVRENNEAGTRWTISGSILTKISIIKTS
jgi:hypothetical protein